VRRSNRVPGTDVPAGVKLALVTTNLRGGGAEKAVIKIATGLAERGHEVHIVLLENVIEYALRDGLRVHCVADSGRLPNGWIGKRRAARALRSLFAKLSPAGDFDLVVSTLPFADEIVSLAHIPRVWYRIANTLSEEIRLLHEKSAGKAVRRLARYQGIYGHAKLIAVSEGVVEDLRGRLELTEARIVRIYNPFDAAEIRRCANEADPEIPSEPYIIHLGRFAKQKRHDLLIEAWLASGVAHQLVLLTPHNEQLAAMISASGAASRITLAGFKQNPYPWIQRADLLVLCSDHEGMPNVLVEALLCGTRVVSTDCPSGPREILTGALRRFLVPCGDVAALAAAIKAALATPFTAPDSLTALAADSVFTQYEGLAMAPKTEH
jgi:glycosyltransferase involved in cell wall biosynthesis